MDDLLAVQAGPLIEPLVQQIDRLRQIIQALHGLEQILLNGAAGQDASPHQAQGRLSQQPVIFFVVGNKAPGLG